MKNKKSKAEFIGEFRSNPRGFGFVRIEGREKDVHVYEEKTRHAMNGDTVRVKILEEMSDGRSEGLVTEILKRGTTFLVGTVSMNAGQLFLDPDRTDIYEDPWMRKNPSLVLREGDKVVASVQSYPGDSKGFVVVPEIRLGKSGDPGIDVLSIAVGMNLPLEFPEEVMKEAKSLPNQVREEDRKGREDFRRDLTITVDGEDSKDFDDAVCLTKESFGWRLSVHIADVSYYVRPGSALDKEALERGNSTYLLDRVLPMLPEKLSNGICSLNPGVERLCYSCVMDLTPEGERIAYRIVPGLMISKRRFTYTEVKEAAELRLPEARERFAEFVPMLDQMVALSKVLRERRFRKGAIDFDFKETHLTLNDRGEVTKVEAYDRNEATKMIEEFMLLANETVAEHYHSKKIPFVYRIHELPDPDKIAALQTFLGSIGLSLSIEEGKEIQPRTVAALVRTMEGRKEEALVERMVLRSLKQARYSTEPCGHFGLASAYYSHFTSPIRRYSDLLIHRIMREFESGELNERRLRWYKANLNTCCEKISFTERRSADAEREVMRFFKASYMRDKIGEEYEGRISGITAFGVFVELENTIEGMIPVRKMLDDEYEYIENTMSLRGYFTKREFHLGEALRIRVEDVNMDRRLIEFAPAEQKAGKRGEDQRR